MYLPQGMKVVRGADGQPKLLGVAAPPQFTLAYAVRSRTVPNATVSAVTETVAADAPAGGSGATAGGYDTAANRDLFIARINQLKVDLEALQIQQVGMAAQALALKGVVTALVDAAQSTTSMMG